MVDYEEGQHQRHWGEKKSMQRISNQTKHEAVRWMRTMHTARWVKWIWHPHCFIVPALLNGCVERKCGQLGGFSNYLLYDFDIIALPPPFFFTCFTVTTASNLAHCLSLSWLHAPSSSSLLPVINTVQLKLEKIQATKGSLSGSFSVFRALSSAPCLALLLLCRVVLCLKGLVGPCLELHTQIQSPFTSVPLLKGLLSTTQLHIHEKRREPTFTSCHSDGF